MRPRTSRFDAARTGVGPGAIGGAWAGAEIAPTPLGILPDICFVTTIDGLRLQFAVGLDMERRPTLFTTQEEAHEEAKNRLLAWNVARQIRIDRRLPEGEVVRVTLHDRDGRVLFEGEVR